MTREKISPAGDGVIYEKKVFSCERHDSFCRCWGGGYVTHSAAATDADLRADTSMMLMMMHSSPWIRLRLSVIVYHWTHELLYHWVNLVSSSSFSCRYCDIKIVKKDAVIRINSFTRWAQLSSWLRAICQGWVWKFTWKWGGKKRGRKWRIGWQVEEERDAFDCSPSSSCIEQERMRQASEEEKRHGQVEGEE